MTRPPDYHQRNRKYGRRHRQTRAAAIAAHQPGNPCALCGNPMTDPPHLLDLAHGPNGVGYQGLAHRTCNRGFDALRRRQQQAGQQPPTDTTGPYVTIGGGPAVTITRWRYTDFSDSTWHTAACHVKAAPDCTKRSDRYERVNGVLREICWPCINWLNSQPHTATTP